MKIKLKRFLALVAAAATALSFAGCVSNNGGTPSDDDSSDGPEIIGGENHTHSWSSVYESDAEGHWKECSGCDEKAEEAAHTFGNWQVEKAATESEGGREYRECTLCGYAEYRDTAAIPHEHVWATTWSSDEDYHWYKCENCEEVSQKAAHTWDDGEVTTEPTETTEGIRTYTCKTCHKTKTEPVAALGHTHSPSKEWSSDDTQHWHACSGCNEKVGAENHTYKDGVCTVCGFKDPDYVAPHEHVAGTKWEVNETQHWHECTECGEPLAAADHEFENGYCKDCNYKDPDYVPPHEHVAGSEWKSNASQHWNECECGEKLNLEDHTWDGGKVTTEPTETATGVKTFTCNECGRTKTETIPATGGNTGGSTGGSDVEDTPPEIVQPVEDAVKITKAVGHLESAYVTWDEVENARWYNVYVKKASEPDSSYTRLDEPLVRKYPTYFRADAVGLAADTYSIKVVPVDGNDAEVADRAGYANNITVSAHDRSGFAFVGGTSSGAYNDNGTLKSNAQVIYITENTKNTVKMDVVTSNKGATTSCTGLQEILNAYKKGYDSTPLSIRLIGNITDLSVMDKGDILIDTDGNDIGITFEGIGSDATANGWGLRLKNARNVEVRNLGFMNCNSNEGDSLGLQQDNNHVWVHNCDFFYGDAGSDADQAKGDGALDTKKSTYVTHSYNHFWDSGKSNLQGMKSETVDNFITYHHNWYDHSDSRHPRIRTCTVHIYNNYFDGNSKYGVGATMGASVFVENNYFRSTSSLRPMMSSGQGTDADGEGTFSGENGGIIKSYGNTYDVSGGGTLYLKTYQQFGDNSDCYEASSRDDTVSASVKTVAGGTTYNNFDTADSMYDYEVESAEQAKETVQKYAGRIDGGDFKYEFNDATEDSNYGVISELKSLLTNYKSELVEVGGDGVASGGNEGGSSEGEGGSTEEGTEGGNEGSEEGGNEGGNTGSEGPSPIDGAMVVTFDGGEYDYDTQDGITITGNTSDSKGSVTYNGVTYDVCLKMESSTNINFTVDKQTKLTLHFNTGSAGCSITINGTEYEVGSDGIIDVTLSPDSYVIEKKDGSSFLYVIVLSPVE